MDLSKGLFMEKLSFPSFEQLMPVWDQDENNKIVNLLNKKHSAYLDDETFELLSGSNKEQVQIKVCLKKNDNSVIYPIEVICNREDHPDLKPDEIARVILDYLDSYWYEYFSEERDLFVPLDWSGHAFEGVRFFLRGFVRNLGLETQADILLKEHGYGEHEILPISSES
jgi:hypothetical protein